VGECILQGEFVINQFKMKVTNHTFEFDNTRETNFISLQMQNI